MGLNFDGVNETMANKLRALASDGKITVEEMKGLSPAEQEELKKALGGVLPSEDIVLNDPVVEQKGKSLLSGVLDWFSDDNVPVWKKLGAGALTLVGAGLGGWGAIALLGVKGALVGGAIAGAAALTSCTTPDVYVYDKDVVNVTVTPDSSVEDIAKAIKDIQELLKLLINNTDKLVAVLEMQGKDIKEIVELLKANNMQNEEIYKAILNNGKTLDVIVELVKENMNSGDKYQQAMMDKLDYIAQLVQDGNKINQNTQDVIVKILAKMDGLEQANAEEKAVLDALLAKLIEFVEQDFAMDEKTQTLLHTIIELVRSGNKIDEDTFKLLKDISEKISQLENSGKDHLNAILNAILAGNKVAKGTQDVALKILEAVGSLNDKGDKALEVLNKLSMGDNNVDLEDLKAFLTATVKGIMDSYAAGNEKVLAKLQEILDKIPEGCHCDPSEILIKLEKIITVLDSDDENHEGILGDLDSIVNGG